MLPLIFREQDDNVPPHMSNELTHEQSKSAQVRASAAGRVPVTAGFS